MILVVCYYSLDFQLVGRYFNTSIYLNFMVKLKLHKETAGINIK